MVLQDVADAMASELAKALGSRVCRVVAETDTTTWSHQCYVIFRSHAPDRERDIVPAARALANMLTARCPVGIVFYELPLAPLDDLQSLSGTDVDVRVRLSFITEDDWRWRHEAIGEAYPLGHGDVYRFDVKYAGVN